MRRFFDTLYSSLNRGARAVLQIYPENAVQAQSLTTAAMRAGFSGGLVVDFPHSTRAKKYFLVLMVGGMTAVPEPKGLSGEASDEEGAHVSVAGRTHGRKKQRTGGHSMVSFALPIMRAAMYGQYTLTVLTGLLACHSKPAFEQMT